MKERLEKIQWFVFCCLAASFPFDAGEIKLNSYLSILSVLMTAVSVVQSTPSGKAGKAKIAVMILFVLFYFIHIAGLVYTDNSKEAGFELQKKISLFLFPLLLFFHKPFDEKKIKTVLLSFAFSCSTIAVFCLGHASVHFFTSNDTSFFFYHSFSNQAGMHAAYLSMYFCFSIVILAFFLAQSFSVSSASQKALFLFSLLFLTLSVVLLGSRTQMLLLIIISAAGIFLFLKSKLGVFRAIVFGILAGIFVVGSVFSVPVNRERLKEAINYKKQYGLDRRWSEEQVRYLIWRSAIDLISQRPFTGMGTGDVQDELHEYYLRKDHISLTYLENTRYNAHNQFLETALGLGIPGLLVLFGIFLTAFALFIKSGNRVGLGLAFIFFISCLTESMLERQYGIVFFAFFVPLLSFSIYSTEESSLKA